MPLPSPSRLLALLTAGQPPPLRFLLQLHAHVVISGLLSSPSPNPFGPRLVAAFAFSDPASQCSPRPFLHALALLASLPYPPDSAAPYNSVLRALSLLPGRCRLLDRCLPLYRALLRSGSARPDHLTFPFLLKACSRMRDPSCGAAVLGHVRRFGFGADLFVLNAAMHFLAVSGSVLHARRLFDESPVRDVVSWNTLIGGYVRRGFPREALELFWRMVEDASVKPDEVTMIGAVSGCAQLQDLVLGKRLHGYVESNGVKCTVKLMNAVMDMYVKCGSLELAKSVFERIDKKTIVSWTTMLVGHSRLGTMEDAHKLFDDMPERDVFPWNALMAGYVQSKRGKEAIALFHEMQEAKVDPNEITMVNLLSACSQLGALEMGMWVHHYIDIHRLSVSAALGTSLVDMFGRRRMHGNITLGEKAAMKLVELDPSDSGIYVLLATMYAEANMRKKADKVRAMMRQLGVEKVPGCSCIELNGVVHEFIVKDKSHADTGAIYDCLHKITLQMRCTASTFDISTIGAM
ncbi:hypothetical protein QOZ80_2BG0179030 [Eleusine coracana subsp. coracana]|nr:hypothetical protein QOZ80_2BG0179030 [Eleusine coracana subsp. coracana]